MFGQLKRTIVTISKQTPHSLSTPKFSALPSFPTRRFSSAPQRLTVQEVEDRVLELLKSFSKTKQEKLTIDAHFVNDLGLDSLDQVEITMELEDEFNVELTDQVAEKIFTVKDAVEAICAIKHSI